MILYYYILMTVASLICSFVYFKKWHPSFEVYLSVVYILIPFANAGYVIVAISKDVGEAITGTKITYIGGCYLLLLVMYNILYLCKIRFSKHLAFFFTLLSTIMYIFVLSIGHSKVFYSSVEIETVRGITTLKKTYGPVHTAFYGLIAIYFIISVGAIIYAIRKKREASKRNIILLAITEAFSIFAFFGGRAVTKDVELIPLAYFVDAFVYLFIVDRLPIYDIGSSVRENLVERGENGYLSFDLKMNYVSSNETARRLLPLIGETRVDAPIPDKEFRHLVKNWVEDFLTDEISREQTYEKAGMTYRIVVGYLYDGGRKRGYQITVSDVTAQSQYIKTISDYNRNLREENEKKDALIRELKKQLSQK